MKTIIYTCMLTLPIALISCKKEKKTDDDAHNHPTVSAVITINSPQPDDTIQGNFTVSGSIVGNETLHGYQITLRKKSDLSVLFQKDVHIHDVNITIGELVTHSQTEYTPVQLEVVVALDHNGNKATKTIDLVVH